MTKLKAIPEWPGYYASEDGQIWSTRAHGRHYGKQKIPKKIGGKTDKDGYVEISLFLNKHRFFRRAHVLILLTFRGPCPPGQQARHLNGLRSDNRLQNLVWGTPEENCADKKKHGTMPYGNKHPNSPLSVKDVLEIRERAGSGETQRSIATVYSISRSTVFRIVHRLVWSHV